MTSRGPCGKVTETPYGVVLAMTRVYDHPQDEVWRFLTEPAALGSWYGTFSGDPAGGSVMLTMVEAPEDPAIVRIDECSAPDDLKIAIIDARGAAWVLSVSLTPMPDGGTRLVFEQFLEGFGMPPGDLGPGWEYYLERLSVALEGKDPETVDFADFHPRLVGHYTLD